VGGFCSIGVLASGTGKRLLGWRFNVCDGAWEAADFLCSFHCFLSLSLCFLLNGSGLVRDPVFAGDV
jgi:hypothetical protein